MFLYTHLTQGQPSHSASFMLIHNNSKHSLVGTNNYTEGAIEHIYIASYRYIAVYSYLGHFSKTMVVVFLLLLLF